MAKPMKTVRRPATGDMPHYKVTQKSYIDGQIVGPGCPSDTVYYNGVPGKNLVPLNDAAKKAKAKAESKPESTDVAPANNPPGPTMAEMTIQLLPKMNRAALAEMAETHEDDSVRTAAAEELASRPAPDSNGQSNGIDPAVYKVTETDLDEVDALIQALTDEQLVALANLDDRKGVKDRVAKEQARRGKTDGK